MQQDVHRLMGVRRVLGHPRPPLPVVWFRSNAPLQHVLLLLRAAVLALELVIQGPEVADVGFQGDGAVEPGSGLVDLRSCTTATRLR